MKIEFDTEKDSFKDVTRKLRDLFEVYTCILVDQDRKIYPLEVVASSLIELQLSKKQREVISFHFDISEENRLDI